MLGAYGLFKEKGKTGGPDWRKIAQRLGFKFKPKHIRFRLAELGVILASDGSAVQWTKDEVYNHLCAV